ncbi:hypothetical protein AB0M50_42415, partial [Nonomuraea fuscirosea]|uniref:hypothetical protein n=1 Tax=Nonomuraea fuscirosea TaxID=1291556 RepID=UPI00343E16B7
MPHRIYVDGEWVPAGGGAAIPVVNPATEEAFAEVPRGDAKDVAEFALLGHQGRRRSAGAVLP